MWTAPLTSILGIPAAEFTTVSYFITTGIPFPSTIICYSSLTGNVHLIKNIRIYDVITGEMKTVKTWDYLDSSGKYHGNYTLHDLGQFKDCIIGVYYSVDVSGDEALAGLDEGETYAYTNTVEWADIDEIPPRPMLRTAKSP